MPFKTKKHESADMGIGKPLRILQLSESDTSPKHMRFMVRMVEGDMELFNQFYERGSYAERRYEKIRRKIYSKNPFGND